MSKKEISNTLTEIQSELNELQEEAYQRENMLDDVKEKDRGKDYKILENILGMQRMIQAYLSSSDFAQTNIGEDITNILQKDSEIGTNKAIAQSLSEIINYTYQSNKVTEGEIPDLSAEDSVSFSSEFVDLEESI